MIAPARERAAPKLALPGDRLPAVMLVALLAVAFALVLGAIVARQPLLAFAALALVPLGVLGATRPDLATLATIALVYSNAAVIAVKLHHLPIVVGASVPLLLLAPLLYGLLVRREPLVIPTPLPWLAAYFVVQLIGVFFALDPEASASRLTTFALEGVGLYLLITNVVRDEDTLRRVIWLLLAVGAFLGALSVYQQMTANYGNDFFGFAQMSNTAFGAGQDAYGREILQPRLAGPLGDQNRYAQIMLVLLPLGFFRVRAERGVRRLAAAGACVFIVAGAALTFSRGAAVAFCILIAVMALMRQLSLRQLAGVALVVVLLLTVVPGFRARLFTLAVLPNVATQAGSAPAADTSARSRATEYLIATLMFADHPVVGVGPGMYRYNFLDYAGRAGQYSEQLDIKIKGTQREAHDLFLGVLAESGVAGFVALGGVIALTFRELSRARRKALSVRPELADIATSFTLAIVAYLATGLFLHFAYIRYFWLLLALAFAASVIVSREADRGLAAAEGSGPPGPPRGTPHSRVVGVTRTG